MIVRVPVRVPLAVGANVTDSVQDSLGLSDMQLLVSEKSPLIDTLLILSVALPELVTVSIWGGLFVPTACVGKVRETGFRLTTGAGAAAPVPVN